MSHLYRPTTELELAETIASGGPFAVSGNNTKQALGRPVNESFSLSLQHFNKLEIYEPEELILEAGAASPLKSLLPLLEKRGQCLAFDPPDFSAVLGVKSAGTLGGLLCTGFAGSRRLKAGSVRDHVLGVAGVTGRGEIFKAGARVVKNVTGYDLPKLMAGSFGTLAALTRITFKVLPKAETEQSICLPGTSDTDAMRLMALAMQSSAEVSSAAHLPGEGTYLRLEGIAVSVTARRDNLLKLLNGRSQILDEKASSALWTKIRDCRVFAVADDEALWRISVPPAEGAATVARIAAHSSLKHYYDWAGGLIWLALPCGDDAQHGLVRRAVTSGHAFLFKAPDCVRARVPVFHPQEPGVAALSKRVKAAFDPSNRLNPGRMGEGG